MATRLEIFRAQRRGIGTFLIEEEEGTLPDIVGKIGYVEGLGDRWDEEIGAVVGTYFNVVYEGVDSVFVLFDDDEGIFTPDPPMNLQRKVRLLMEEDAYVASLNAERSTDMFPEDFIEYVRETETE